MSRLIAIKHSRSAQLPCTSNASWIQADDFVPCFNTTETQPLGDVDALRIMTDTTGSMDGLSGWLAGFEALEPSCGFSVGLDTQLSHPDSASAVRQQQHLHFLTHSDAFPSSNRFGTVCIEVAVTT